MMLRVKSESILSASEDECCDFDNTPVHRITIPEFYKPHSIGAIIFLGISLLVAAFCRDGGDLEANIFYGVLAILFTFTIISLFICPNGPFTRPHPAVWRIFLGWSVLYLLFLSFLLFQKYETVREIFHFFDPELRKALPDTKLYAVDCNKFSKFLETIDIFTFSHFIGSAAKAMIIRHAGLMWYLSIMWEITEMFFTHLLPNFAECWWDSIVLDVLLCNALGIYFGLYLCKKMEMRKYVWESFLACQGTKQKLNRVILQFTPETWSTTEWMSTTNPTKRFFYLCAFVVVFLTNELNCFFLKHIFIVPSKHYFNLLRLALTILLGAPAIRQYYVYITDARCKRLGTHAWMHGCITLVELLLCIKNGKELFTNVKMMNVVFWLLFQFLVCFVMLAIMMSWTNIKALFRNRKQLKGINSMSQVLHPKLFSRRRNVISN